MLRGLGRPGVPASCHTIQPPASLNRRQLPPRSKFTFKKAPGLFSLLAKLPHWLFLNFKLQGGFITLITLITDERHIVWHGIDACSNTCDAPRVVTGRSRPSHQ